LFTSVAELPCLSAGLELISEKFQKLGCRPSRHHGREMSIPGVVNPDFHIGAAVGTAHR